jgi:NADPH:quinone reductase-like Zn-dependent oxidoreductase
VKAVAVTTPGGFEALEPVERDVVFVRTDSGRLAALVAAVAAGTLTTRVDRTLPLRRAAEAHRIVERDHPRGKVVLIP